MNKFDLEKIVETLSDNGFSFNYIENTKLNHDFQLASLKSLIDYGIYYLDGVYEEKVNEIKNSIIICSRSLETTNNLFIVDNPQLVHYKLCAVFEKKFKFSIAKSTKINPNAIIAANVEIGENCVVENCVIEENVIIRHNVVIEDNVIIKKNTFIDSNSVIGAGGLAWIWDSNGERVMQPQLGGVVIEENCILATDVTIVKGSLSENTIIGKGTVISHGTKIGHGTQISRNVHMANNVSIAGNAVIGERSFLGSACVISSNVEVGKNTIVGAGAVVSKSNSEEYTTMAGVPAKIIKRNNFENKPNGAPKPYKY